MGYGGTSKTSTARSSTAILWSAVLTLVATGTLQAQAPGSPVVPAGTLGFQVRPEVRIWNSRFGLREAGTVEEVEPLGFDFSNTDFGSLIPDLAATEQALRDLTGDPTFGVALGRSRVRLNALRIEIPVTASLGITDWLTVTGTVPFVRRRMEVDFALTGDGRTVGFSPGLSDDAVTLYLSQFQQSIADVQQAADDFCATSGEGDPGCMDLRAVVSDANLLFGQLDAGYASALFPSVGSSGATALVNRLTVLRERMVMAGDATFIDSTWTAPLPLASPGTTGGIDALFADPAAGILAEPLDGFQSVWEIGDVEVGAWVRLLDVGGQRAVGGPSAGADAPGPLDSARATPAAARTPAGEAGAPRQERLAERPLRLHLAAGATFRLGTGVSDRPDNFVDLGSGDGQNDVEVHGFAYVGVGSRLSARGTVRYGIQMVGDVARRISAPDQPIALAASQGVYQWDPGDYVDVSIAPEYRLTPELSVGARLRYYRRGEDVYSSASVPQGFDLTLLQRETREDVQYIGAGVTLWPSARTRLLGQWPMAASVAYMKAISGGGGRTPKDDSLQLDVRLFFGVW